MKHLFVAIQCNTYFSILLITKESLKFAKINEQYIKNHSNSSGNPQYLLR